MRITFHRAVERWVSRIQNEENYSHGKKVNNVALVGLALMNFGCHVTLGAENGFQEASSITALNGRCKPEVSHLDVEAGVQHNIFRLKVAVAGALGMHKVHSLKHLTEVVTTDFW